MVLDGSRQRGAHPKQRTFDPLGGFCSQLDGPVCAAHERRSLACGVELEAGSYRVSGSGQVHVDPAAFRIVFPQTWRLRTDVPGLAVVGVPPGQAGPFADNVGVIGEDTGSADLTVEQYLSAAQRLAPRAVEDFQAVSRAVRTVTGRPQGLLEYTSRAGGRALHHLAVVVLRPGRACAATLTAAESTYAELLPAAAPVLASFRAR